jgi:hypothetical protein
MLCKIILVGFGTAYALALALFLIGTLGLFGQERDPLSGVFLLPLGLPWVWATGRLPDGLIRATAAAGAPLVNLGILALVCRALQKR